MQNDADRACAVITAIEWNLYTHTYGPAVCGELVIGAVAENDDLCVGDEPDGPFAEVV